MSKFRQSPKFTLKAGSLLIAAILALTALTITHRSSAKQERRSAKGRKPSAEIQVSQETPELAALKREVDAKRRNPKFLLTRTAIFDPLAQEPQAVRIGAASLETVNMQAARTRLAAKQSRPDQTSTASETRGYFIVQFNRPIQAAWTENLRARGYEIGGYLPNNAYIVKVTAAESARLKSLGEVRWVGAYGPGLKVESGLAQMADQEATAQATLGIQTADSADLVSVSFVTFRGEEAGAIREALSAVQLAGEPVIEERGDERLWGVLPVSRANLSAVVTALANLEGIEWVEQRRPKRLQNDNAVRAIQTGYLSSDTPLYRNGLTGAGQIYGTADTGLDSDHVQFRYGGDSSAQTLSYATSTASLVNGLLPVSTTNSNNKVLTYYLLGSSGFVDESDNPNGGRTLDATKMSGSRYLNAVAYDDSGAQYHGTLTTSVAVGRNYGANGSGAVPGIPTRSTGDGIAPDARIVFQDVGHPSGQLPGVDSVSQAQIHRQAYSTGVRVHNNSYGPAPPAIYDQDAADVDDMMWRLRDYTIFFSAGNNSSGAYQVTNAAKNDVVVGATDSPTGKGSFENLASYSNHGPTFDGRLKPDIVAPGTVIGATENSDSQNSSSYGSSTSATAQDAGVNPDDPNNESTLTEEGVSGTSFASAAAAGGALLVRQYFTDGYYPNGARSQGSAFNPSNALIKAIILNSGRNLTGRYTAGNYPLSTSGPLPNNGQGWGRLALDDALYFSGDRRELKVLADIWNGATAADSTRPASNPALMTGQTHTYQIANVSNLEPLRITLTWSDPRAAVGSVVALVNDLNLEVVAPDGTIYRGNINFSNAQSQAANGAAFDDRNPIEAVYLQNPQVGTYTVRVIGQNVPGNGLTGIVAQPNNQSIDSNRQGYALVATGNFTAGPQPVLNLASSAISGGVNADPFISKNETVTATITVNNPSPLAAQNVGVTVEVDGSSQVPAGSIRLNGGSAGAAAAFNLGNVASGATATGSVQITLLDDGVLRVGQAIVFKVTMTPSNGLPFVMLFSSSAQLKLVTYRTRFEPAVDPGGGGVVVIPEADWKKRTDQANRADEDDPFDGDWPLTGAVFSANNGSTSSLSDPSGAAEGYGVGSTSRSDGLVYDDTRWWTPKLALPGLLLTDSTGLVSNPEQAANIQAQIDSFEVDVKADFSGDIAQSVSSGDFFILRARTYNNTVSIRSTDDSGATEADFTNLLYLDAKSVANNGFIHYSGNNFASGDGVFSYEDDEEDADNSEVFFRFELQFRRNSYPQSGDGIFVDNLVVRLRVADTAVYTSPVAGSVTTVDAAGYTGTITQGELVAAFGSGFPAGTSLNSSATSLPLPTELSQVSVKVNGVAAPLLFVGVDSTGLFQINYQMPYETKAGAVDVEVLSGTNLVASEYLVVSGLPAPAVFTADASGQGQAIAQNQDFSRNGDPSLNPGARPEARGNYLIVYGTGQGWQLLDSVSHELLRLPSGYPAPTDGQTFITASTPTVTIGGVAATVSFSGLAPGYVGLWQINVLIPANAPTGTAVPLVVSMGGASSRTTTVAIN
ncbi:MAG TPA: S8 family serine peptidase [Blastocatellia bacterium]|nr:S8 family serine peptidase [Blastocatellia bacterium]